ncbi:MAG: Mov34/MPN/PAD-1 family protein [Nitrososphaera sp.]
MVSDKPVPRKYVAITRQVADGIITYSRTKHPNEAILVLQGKSNKDHILIDRLVIPPFSMSGPYYSGFPVHDLPFDLSYMGTVHSHPGGSNKPSLEDLNHFYGLVSLIISHPYEDETLGAYDRSGNALELKIVES